VNIGASRAFLHASVHSPAVQFRVPVAGTHPAKGCLVLVHVNVSIPPLGSFAEAVRLRLPWWHSVLEHAHMLVKMRFRISVALCDALAVVIE
jgi:hypothetical protein